jgi:PAS domain-containing protein
MMVNQLEQKRYQEMNRVYLKPLIILLLLGFCSLFYYFGELIDWAAWNTLRNDFFYGIHDVHRLLFLAPIIYAGYTARVKGAVIVTLISFIIFLPRAFFISPYPDPLLRMVMFVIFAGVVGSLVGIVRNQSERAKNLEIFIASEKDKLLKILDGMADGVIITGPDYTIRYMNSKMVNALGNGIGLTCYHHLRKRESPCTEECRVSYVITKGKIEKWHCSLPDGRSYEVVAAPYIDTDGIMCQISVFRDIVKLNSSL